MNPQVNIAGVVEAAEALPALLGNIQATWAIVARESQYCGMVNVGINQVREDFFWELYDTLTNAGGCLHDMIHSLQSALAGHVLVAEMVVPAVAEVQWPNVVAGQLGPGQLGPWLLDHVKERVDLAHTTAQNIEQLVENCLQDYYGAAKIAIEADHMTGTFERIIAETMDAMRRADLLAAEARAISGAYSPDDEFAPGSPTAGAEVGDAYA